MLYYVALLPLRDNSIIISILNFLFFFFSFLLKKDDVKIGLIR